MVAEELSDLLARQTNPTIAPLASEGEVKLRLTTRTNSVEEAVRLLDEMEAKVRERLGIAVFGIDQETLEQVVVRLLTQRHENLAVAESCTGGLLASRITDVPGASEVLDRGVVTYSNRAKEELLGIPSEVIFREGAVSPEVAKLMAQGVKEKSSTDWGIGITGIAGPGGGTPEKPVGLVYLALEGPKVSLVRELRWNGDRISIKRRTTQAALDLLRRELLKRLYG